jgi:ABC-type polysaccharide/polyol phosphate transport system ATPase subunit
VIPLARRDVVVDLVDVRKVYRVYHGQGRGYLRSLLSTPARRHRHFSENLALDRVSLTIERGEVLGILGRNGSGKSTLLRLMAGLTRPTEGTVHVFGSVRCLLGTGVGFNPRFTGRENILFGSMAMGIPQEVAQERMDEIIEFAELHEQIDQPTLVYSAGMKTRLAAAVAFQEVPEIFMLDEALSAGDAYFSKKCDARIEDMCASGKTVILVTHSPSAVQRLCTRALLVDRGRVIEDGPPEAVIGSYQRSVASARQPAQDADSEAGGIVELDEAVMCGADGEPTTEVRHGEAVELRVRLRTEAPVESARFSLDLFSADAAVRVTSLGTRYVDAETGQVATFGLSQLEGTYELVVRWPQNPLGTGDYYWNLTLWPPLLREGQKPQLYLRAYRIAPFRCVSFPGDRWMERQAMLEPRTDIRLRPLTRDSPHGRPLHQLA